MLNPTFSSFSSSFGNSAIEMIILDIKYRFTCGELTFHNNTLNCKDYNYVTNCLKIAHLHLRLPILGNCSILARLRKLYQNPPCPPPALTHQLQLNTRFWLNADTWNSTYRKLFNLKLSCNLFAFIFIKSSTKIQS